MKVKDIIEILNAEVMCRDDLLEQELHTACGSDMMSDVLAFVKEQAVLLTGLVNPQVVRTAEMMEPSNAPDFSALGLCKEASEAG